ncbi:MAG: Uma2 family endonuclease [Chloroflexota bacterium]|nr:Uma2 family endonuclease [Chloroflexota bacterium]
MAAPLPAPYVTAAEYLARERRSAVKSEYLDGYIVAMAGVRRAHSLISTNLARLLETQLEERPCEVHIADMRVKVSARNVYTYPDIAVVCGDAHYEDRYGDTLLNPTVLIEILSPSTEDYDRGVKFDYYRHLPSLREYLLVAQTGMHVEHFILQEEDWVLTEAHDPATVLYLPSIECRLPMSRIYNKVGDGAPTR